MRATINLRRPIIEIEADFDENSIKANGYEILRWIPCGERLPENDDWQIVTVLDETGDTPFRYTDFGWYLEAAKCWIINAEQRTDIVAWMPLPEPFAERRTDEVDHRKE